MASIEEVRAGIGQANDKAQESLGALQQAHSSLEQAQGLLQRSTEGSSQADVNEANGLLPAGRQQHRRGAAERPGGDPGRGRRASPAMSSVEEVRAMLLGAVEELGQAAAGTRSTPAAVPRRRDGPARRARASTGSRWFPPSCGVPPTSSTAGSGSSGPGSNGSPTSRRGCRPVAAIFGRRRRIRAAYEALCAAMAAADGASSRRGRTGTAPPPRSDRGAVAAGRGHRAARADPALRGLLTNPEFGRVVRAVEADRSAYARRPAEALRRARRARRRARPPAPRGRPTTGSPRARRSRRHPRRPAAVAHRVRRAWAPRARRSRSRCRCSTSRTCRSASTPKARATGPRRWWRAC